MVTVNILLSGCVYSRKDSRRKSTGGSNPVHAIVAGGAAKPLSPLASGQHMPLSPLARTPSPGPERYQQVVFLLYSNPFLNSHSNLESYGLIMKPQV